MKNFIMASIGALRPWETAVCGTCTGWGTIINRSTGKLVDCPSCKGSGR